MRLQMSDESREFGGVLRVEHKGGLGRPQPMGDFKPTDLERHITSVLVGFMRLHPCIGAKALAQHADVANMIEPNAQEIAAQGLHLAVYPDMSSVASAVMALTDIEAYLTHSDRLDPIYKTLVLIFPTELVASQDDFARKYWAFAQKLSDISLLTHRWPQTIAYDPSADTFELCLAGRPIFTTTLNPQSARTARKFAYCAWVMNQTSQFDALRERGLFSRWQRGIRGVDAALDPSGHSNPILQDHGVQSAAPQLAGSALQPCPFEPRISKPVILRSGEELLKAAIREGAPEAIQAELSHRLAVARA